MSRLGKELKVLELRLVVNNTKNRSNIKILKDIAEKMDILIDCPNERKEQVCAMSGWVGRLESNSDNSMFFRKLRDINDN